MNKQRKSTISKNALSEIRTYRLAGYTQKVLFEGLYKTNPIILTLHGGPGIPIPLGVGCRGMFPQLTDKFILICWDQLGCGANNHLLPEHLTIDSFAEMTEELILLIKEEFPENPLILFGTSWGSILAAKAAERCPSLIDQVIVYGQVSKKPFFNQVTFQALEQAQIPAKKQQLLKKIQLTPTYKKSEGVKISQWVSKYTDGYYGENEDKTEMKALSLGLLRSPDYRIRDFVGLFLNGYLTNKRLWRELFQIDLTETFQSIRVPYRIIQGACDLVTPTEMISELLSTTENPYIQLEIINGLGHIPDLKNIEHIFKKIDFS